MVRRHTFMDGVSDMMDKNIAFHLQIEDELAMLDFEEYLEMIEELEDIEAMLEIIEDAEDYEEEEDMEDY